MPENDVKLDIDYIVKIVQDILNKNHTDTRKKKLILKLEGSGKEINMNCPICGDGKNVRFRGHLYFNTLRYVCYNERESDSMSFSKFCRHFGVELNMDKKIEIYNYLDNNWKYEKKDDFVIDSLDKLVDLNNFIKMLNDKKDYLFNVGPIQQGSMQYNYLIHRKITNFNDIYQGSFKLSSTWIEPVIVILNRSAEKLLGMQIRNLKEDKKNRIYKFSNFQEIHNRMYPDDPLDNLEAISYNKLSSIFNVLNVDFDAPLHVFEGYLDSLFFPNSIALVGLDTDISFLSNDNLDLRFVMDNDLPGQKKTKEMIEQNYSVFLWKRLIKDLSGNKTKLKSYFESEVKDINKLAEFYDDFNIYHTKKLDRYFAKDKFDLIDM